MEIRNPKPDELTHLTQRISVAFGYQPGEGSVGRDFPLLYKEQNAERLWVATEAGKIVGHAGVYLGKMKLGRGILPVAAVGGVYTEEDYRSQGLGRKLLERAVAGAGEAGAALAFLWSDKHEFYAKLGYFPAGEQIRASLDASLQSRIAADGARDKPTVTVERGAGAGKKGFPQASLALLSEHPFGIARSLEEHLAYMTCGASEIWSAWRGSDLIAYFLVGKGKDLPGYVHEWAGDPDALQYLLGEFLLKNNSPETQIHVIGPPSAREASGWLARLEAAGAKMHSEIMGLVKILDLPALEGFAREELLGRNISLNPQLNGKYLLEYGDERFEAEGHELVTLLQAWYWGMDSV